MPTADPRDGAREIDEQDYGRAHGYDQHSGNFLRRRENGPIRVIDGPVMVGRQLARTLHTYQGEDPIRPDYGLDTDLLLGESDLHTKQAIIDAIGPRADGRVRRLEPEDIEIERPPGDRENTEVSITVHLADGRQLELGAGSDWWRQIAARSEFSGARNRS